MNISDILTDTWGHLLPEIDKVYIGSIRIARSIYGDDCILADNVGITSSPWWYIAITDFVYNFLSKMDSPGTVFEIQVHCTMDKDNKFKLSNMGYKVLLK